MHCLKILVILLALLFISHLSSLTSHLVFADTVSDDDYSIDVNDIDTNPQPTPRQQVLKNLIQSPLRDFTTGPNYTVNASTDSFLVNLSQTTIDYGILSATNPVFRTSHISLHQPENGAEVLTYEDHPLQDDNAIIPDTSCDNGSCTPSIAAIWKNTLTYGFGYRCDNKVATVCDIQFLPSNTYKPYPNINNDDTPTPLAITPQRLGDSSLTLSYKVTISGMQKTGGYTNTITYLAVPNF